MRSHSQVPRSRTQTRVPKATIPSLLHLWSLGPQEAPGGFHRVPSFVPQLPACGLSPRWSPGTQASLGDALSESLTPCPHGCPQPWMSLSVGVRSVGGEPGRHKGCPNLALVGWPSAQPWGSLPPRHMVEGPLCQVKRWGQCRKQGRVRCSLFSVDTQGQEGKGHGHPRGPGCMVP